MRIPASLFVVVASALLLGACENGQFNRSGTENQTAAVTIEPSTRSVVAGETVTFVGRTRDTYGRKANLKWTSTAGRLTTEEDGRVARVRFDEPGTYTVRATLSVDGRDVQGDMVEIRVRPLN